MSDNHKPKPPIPQADMGAPSSRNVEKMLKFMADQRGSPTGSDVATMDDAQFMASLDALLETGNSSPPPSCEEGQPAPSSRHTRTKDKKHAPVSTATSCASSTSSSKQKDAEGSALSSMMTSGVTGMSGASSTFPHPQTVMFPASTGAKSTGPSPLTARLAYNFLAPSPVPSTVSSLSMPPTASATNTISSGSRQRNKRAQSSDRLAPVSEDESEWKRRRLDRNMREQERSHRISDRIDQLRDVLADAKVKSKSDKYSTLVSVVEYIKGLQQRSAMLDEEHRKLLSTIEQTNELANSPFFTTKPTTGEASIAQVSTSSTSDSAMALMEEEEEDYGVFVKGLDYKSVFAQNCIALAIASIDGRFLDCNDEFVSLSGFSRDELLPSEAANSNDDNTTLRPDSAPDEKAAAVMPTPRNLSLFNLLTREDMEEVFAAMSNMLKKPVVTAEGQLNIDKKTDYWTGVVKQSRDDNQKLTIVVTLVRSPRGRPKFFNCALTPAT